MIRLACSLLICLVVLPCRAAEYAFFAGEDYEVKVELGVRDGSLVSTLTMIGSQPDPYISPGYLRYFIETQELVHEFFVNDIPVAVSQDLTVQWLVHNQVMQTWSQSDMMTVALTQWELLHFYIEGAISQSIKAGQGQVFTVVPSWEDTELLMGDINLDGGVSDDDLSVLLSYWGWGQRWSTGDLNGDESVNDDDLSLLLANWNEHIPEPSSLVIVLLGCIMIRRMK